VLRCILYEDEHLLVVNKPAGWNTHAPAPYAAEGIYDWLRNRDLRWSGLSTIHRLDKDTSGVIVFGKSGEANRALTAQFTGRSVRKRYLFLSDQPLPKEPLTVRGVLVRAGERYLNRAVFKGGDVAETRFRLLSKTREGWWLGEAVPLTGRTHQIRAQAAAHHFPVLGDSLYGGTAFTRLCLHAADLAFAHPVTGSEMAFEAPVDFAADVRWELHLAGIELELTNSFRLVHGASDGEPQVYIDALGDQLLVQSHGQFTATVARLAEDLRWKIGARAVWHKILDRHVRGASPGTASPEPVPGGLPSAISEIRENGVRFQLRFGEGYSTGLFLDQRDNRRRLLSGYVAPGFTLPMPRPALGSRGGADNQPEEPCSPRKFEVLNTFAYTCGFSVCAALSGARTTSLDLSRKYLDWGKENFQLNRLDPTQHDFIYGDVFDWLKRLGRKGRLFDLILLDPPTFSQSRESGVFRVEKDYARLVRAALPLLRSEAVLFASCNAATWPGEKFQTTVEEAVLTTGRKILQRHYSPQPPDFPISRAEPAYLKTLWLKVSQAGYGGSRQACARRIASARRP
jgi:23S rRNA (cytosine1962-C5)-methyltransferase